jgi:hypothetical protein
VKEAGAEALVLRKVVRAEENGAEKSGAWKSSAEESGAAKMNTEEIVAGKKLV